jgi:hypothetical protein
VTGSLARMGLLLILIGVILILFGWTLVGIVLVVAGAVVFFLPLPGSYGYSHWHGRRAPPP